MGKVASRSLGMVSLFAVVCFQAASSVASMLGYCASLEPWPQTMFHATMMVRVPNNLNLLLPVTFSKNALGCACPTLWSCCASGDSMWCEDKFAWGCWTTEQLSSGKHSRSKIRQKRSRIFAMLTCCLRADTAMTTRSRFTRRLCSCWL